MKSTNHPNGSFSIALAALLVLPCSAVVRAGTGFVNWETPHVFPLALTPDGNTLLAVNTPDNRLEVFDVSTGTPVSIGQVPVGLDPVSLRPRTSSEVWVVNHVSDSVSIVSLTTMNVVATLATADEPCDVVFAGAPLRAFVSCSQANRVQVFDPANLASAPINVEIDAEDPRAMAVSADGGRVYVAVFESGNGSTILGGGSDVEDLMPPVVEFFPPNVVSDPAGPYGGTNPPPNDGAGFNPPINPALPPPPPVGLIVKKDALGRWVDDNEGDWTNLVNGPQAGLSGRVVGWDLPDRDVAILDANTLALSYATRLMNLNMALAVQPATGRIAVVGTDATNEVRFEPNLSGRFLRVNLALIEPDGATQSIVDLNPHLDYTVPTVQQAVRDQSIGDPRGIVWNAAGTRGYVSGMGSNNVVVIDAAGARLPAESEIGFAPAIEVGEGPTGLVLDEPCDRLYVLNKFESSISVIDTTSGVELLRVSFFDPSPMAIKIGRRHLYGTHETSGLGHTACASCHPDARMDRLAWDLGDPTADMFPFDQNCNFGSNGPIPDFLGPQPCPDWHPMKGPMVTQTLQDIIGLEPHHWRGDRDGIEEFNQTFENLQGDDEQLSPEEMQEFEDFLATIHFPPNPFRNLNNSLPANLAMPDQVFGGMGGAPGTPMPNGNAISGLGNIFQDHHVVALLGMSCSECHTLPTGMATNQVMTIAKDMSTSFSPYPTGPMGEKHHGVVFSPMSETPNISIKVPHLRNLHEKVGFDMTSTTSRSGFGFLHDGSVDTLGRFMAEPAFIFELGAEGPPESTVPDVTAFLLAFSGSDLPIGMGIPSGPEGSLSQDAHAAVGRQITFTEQNRDDPSLVAMLEAFISLADAVPDFTPGPMVGLVAKGVQDGFARGYTYAGSQLFQSDRAAETITATALGQSASEAGEITFTVVPRGSETRIGIDRDSDGFFDRDEIDVGADPADPESTPLTVGMEGDLDSDGDVDLMDYAGFQLCFTGPGGGPVGPDCARAEFDNDGDVDLADYGAFQVAFMGPL